MASRSKRVYYNSDTDTWSDDGREQMQRKPESMMVDHDPSVAKEDKAKQADTFHEELEETNEGRYRGRKKRNIEADKGEKEGSRKYRRYMSKDVQSKTVQKIAEDGLDRHVSRNEFQDELFDDGVSSKEYKKDALQDYESEFNARASELPDTDRDKDGDIDEDDIEFTPGMRKMAKYM